MVSLEFFIHLIHLYALWLWAYCGF